MKNYLRVLFVAGTLLFTVSCKKSTVCSKKEKCGTYTIDGPYFQNTNTVCGSAQELEEFKSHYPANGYEIIFLFEEEHITESSEVTGNKKYRDAFTAKMTADGYECIEE